MRIPLISLTCAALALAVHTLPGANEALQFDRAALAHGEHWRWLTAHFAHFGMNHLAWDVAVLLVLGCLCESVSRIRTVLALGLAAATITPVVWFWQPEFTTYRGLSGLDSAMFGLFAATLVRRDERAAKLVGFLALVGFGAKCAAELATGATVFAAGTGYAPVPLAHALGLACGALAGHLRPHRLRHVISDVVELFASKIALR